MTFKAKQQTELNLIDDDGQQLLRSRLPRHWRLREYRPDFGLDYALEIFAPANKDKSMDRYETLGEHIFIQLKTIKSGDLRPLKVYGRMNVEKAQEILKKEDLIGEIDTIRFPLDTAELVTVERMGIAVPVLLVVADLSSQKCFFVCLNDYIDKILIPRYSDYRDRQTRTIHVPVLNEVGSEIPGRIALRWYAKRAKLMAAFQRFVYQKAELDYAWGSPEGIQLAKYFAERISLYDFWDDTEMWGLIPYYGAAVRRLLSDGTPGLMKLDNDGIANVLEEVGLEGVEEIKKIAKASEIPLLWEKLSILPRNYEDVCREWYLPTALGVLESY